MTTHGATVTGHRASARVVAACVDGRTRCSTIRSQPPLTFRSTSAGIIWVGTAAGPIGGDDLRLSVSVEADAELIIGSAGASIVLPGPDGATSQMFIDIDIAERSSLIWKPEPTVLAAGSRHRSVTTISCSGSSQLIWVDELVLGRHGEQPGELSSRLSVDGPDGPVLCTGLEIGQPGWDGPAGMAGHRAISQMLLIGLPAKRWSAHPEGFHSDSPSGPLMSTTSLASGASLVTLVAPSARALRATVDLVVQVAAGAVAER